MRVEQQSLSALTMGPNDLALPWSREVALVFRDPPTRFVHRSDKRSLVVRVPHLYAPAARGHPPLWLPDRCEEVSSFTLQADLLWLQYYTDTFYVRSWRAVPGGLSELLGLESAGQTPGLTVKAYAEREQYELVLASLTQLFWPEPMGIADALEPRFYLKAVLERL